MSASGWSGEFTAVECRDLQATAMCVDALGRWALLAGRRFLATVSLDPAGTISRHARAGKYEVGAAACCPLRPSSAALATNQHIELVDVSGTSPRVQHALHAHSRLVTDLDWHAADAHVLATCSADTFTHVWDVREPRRPAITMAAVAEAAQVRWCRASASPLLATAHDGDVRVWDRRRPTQPLHYIAAHLAKIHGVQWAPRRDTELATCSQDGTVKLWDVRRPRRAAHCVTAAAQPVWRVRYTPFGRGLVTVALPAQLAARRSPHDHSLLLWSVHAGAQPQHAFVGHEDVVLEMDWRWQSPTANTDHQLVTWAKDGTLRIWRVDQHLQKLCGHAPSTDNDVEARTTPGITTDTHTLQHEFSLLNLNIPGTEVVEMDAAARSCAVSVGDGRVLVRVVFPTDYPSENAPPAFTVTPDTPDGELSRVLQQAARDRVSRSRTCLEPCLRRLVQALDTLPTPANGEGTQNVATTAVTPGTYNDACVPFPRTCGARFCSVNTLVCYTRAPQMSRRSTGRDNTTPRALSALAPDLATVSAFYHQDRKQHRSRSGRQKGSTATTSNRPIITIYCARGLFFLERSLGERYLLDGGGGGATAACRHNASAAALIGRQDLVHAWRTAELAARFQQTATTDFEDGCTPWSHHPFGRRLVHSLVQHYAARGDLQTAAVLSCVFGKRCGGNNGIMDQPKSFGNPKSNVYHTVGGADIACTAESWSLAQLRPANRRRRSLTTDIQELSDIQPIPQTPPEEPQLDRRYKHAYAEVLHRWSLLYARADLLKYMPSTPNAHKGVEFVSECGGCAAAVRGAHCASCRKYTLSCALCRVSVRGSANFCMVCGHGGHANHVQAWFASNKLCPTGCGCRCLQETASLIASH